MKLQLGPFRLSAFLAIACNQLPWDASAALPIELYTLNNYSLLENVASRSSLEHVPRVCRVLHALVGAGTFKSPPGLLDHFDFVITDDKAHVDFMGTRGKFVFLEDRSYPLRDLGRQLAQMKETLPMEHRRNGMSLLLPSSVNTVELAQIVQDAAQVMPGNIFIDDGTYESRSRAFYNFTFTALLNLDTSTPPQAVVDCLMHGSVPILIGKHHMLNYSQYFPFAVVKFSGFDVEFAINFMLNTHSDAFYVYGNSLKMSQEFFHMRYRHPYQPRLWRHMEAACRTLEQPAALLAFISIYSALGNFGRRSSLRETWLPLLRFEQPRVSYKFFLADTMLGAAGREIDRLARREQDLYGDMIFLGGTTDEYPIGRKGLAAMKWAAHHTEAQFWLKMDDDIYLRLRPVLDRIGRMQRAEAYWGAFDYSGMVVRELTHPHHTPPEVWSEPVFPPYARGAALVMSIDMLRAVVEQEEIRPFKKIVVEDVSYGYYIWQLVIERELSSVTLIDGDEKHFAMDPKCCTEASHPNNCWLPLNDVTWIVHHIAPDTVRCMFAADARAGLYVASDPVPHRTEANAFASVALAYDDTLRKRPSLHAGWQPAGSNVDWNKPLPDLCGCVYTPPPHPGRPLQAGAMQERPEGPRLR